MGKFDTYKVDLKGMRQDVQKIEYFLDNSFFTAIGGEDVPKGKVKVDVTVTKTGNVFSFAFHLAGTAVIPCDRCLDDMDFPVDAQNRLIVKFGKDYAEESDEIVIVPEAEGVINLAWFLYEFIALAIPIKHVHVPGKCNKQMSAKLKKHTAKLTGEDEEEGFGMEENEEEMGEDEAEKTNDPRWDILKDFEID